ncbi:MAG TPA: hypothetical protein VGN20_16200 [Mucilaginibacter sp.]|jgi:hypothetical protein
MLINNTKIYYTLRFASAMCFIGHGSFGIITKHIWCNYFAVFGIGHDAAYHLMPVLGVVDILMGISLLVYPTRAILLWLVTWGVITALLRPLSGESFAETIERAGNYGVPIALLILCGIDRKNINGWFKYAGPGELNNNETLNRIITCLKIVVFLLFIGHGWLNLTEKKGLIAQYSLLHISRPAQTAHLVGIVEIASALIVLIRPVRHFLLFLFIWKMTSELFYPHWELFEWIERAGSYGAILTLWFALSLTSSPSRNMSPAL